VSKTPVRIFVEMSERPGIIYQKPRSHNQKNSIMCSVCGCSVTAPVLYLLLLLLK